MLKLAILVFAIGAVGGLILANSVLRGRLASWGLSILHAALGATGLVLTAIVVLGGKTDLAKVVPIALIILVVAALAGFYLASVHARKASPPRGAVIAHAGIAVVGFLLLVGGAFQLIG
jgi:FtsH-binding integral membrane protein